MEKRKLAAIIGTIVLALGSCALIYIWSLNGDNGSNDPLSSPSALGPTTTSSDALGTDPFGSTTGGGATPTTGSSTGAQTAVDATGVVKVMVRKEAEKTARRLALAFNASQSGMRVQLVVDSGAGVLARLRQGEQPDIVMENRKHLRMADSENLLSWRPLEFAIQVPVIVVAKGNPQNIQGLGVFGADGSTRSGLCVPTKNCGKTALILLHRAGLTAAPDVVLPGATAAINALRTNQIDAAILDGVKAANRKNVVDKVNIPDGINVISTHWQLSSATGSPAADAFSNFVFSSEGATVLASRGLLPPVA
ncbi:MAG: molybdate-binding protein [Acidimicrobiales bacterium]|nr:molybdate-binding protein [Acidimicrobiales bacterium]